MHERLARSGDGALLFHYPEYDSLPAGDRDAIDALVSTVRVAAGEMVFRRGDPGDAMFVVKSGRFRVTGATPSGAEVTSRGDRPPGLGRRDGRPHRTAPVRVPDGRDGRRARPPAPLRLRRARPPLSRGRIPSHGRHRPAPSANPAPPRLGGALRHHRARGVPRAGGGRRVAARERRRGPHPAGRGERRDVRRRHRPLPDDREGPGRRGRRRPGDRRLQHARRAGPPDGNASLGHRPRAPRQRGDPARPRRLPGLRPPPSRGSAEGRVDRGRAPDERQRSRGFAPPLPPPRRPASPSPSSR